ncbi:MAG: phage holin [Clostridia bacterium]|nr:phage holin [Clostridia bacterium]
MRTESRYLKGHELRFNNKAFWVLLIPAVLLFIEDLALMFGVVLDLSQLEASLLNVIESLFGILVIVGVVVDPTTKGVADSNRALTYSEPQ